MQTQRLLQTATALTFALAIGTEASAQESCEGLQGLRIAPEAIGLPTGGAVIDKAAVTAADASKEVAWQNWTSG